MHDRVVPARYRMETMGNKDKYTEMIIDEIQFNVPISPRFFQAKPPEEMTHERPKRLPSRAETRMAQRMEKQAAYGPDAADHCYRLRHDYLHERTARAAMNR